MTRYKPLLFLLALALLALFAAHGSNIGPIASI